MKVRFLTTHDIDLAPNEFRRLLTPIRIEIRPTVLNSYSTHWLFPVRHKLKGLNISIANIIKRSSIYQHINLYFNLYIDIINKSKKKRKYIPKHSVLCEINFRSEDSDYRCYKKYNIFRKQTQSCNVEAIAINGIEIEDL